MELTYKVMQSLQELGLQPKKEDFGIIFRYQMLNYIYIEDEDDEKYFSLNIPFIFEVDEDNEHDVLKAADMVNKELKVVKIVLKDGHVWISFEAKMPDLDEMEEFVGSAVAGLHCANTKFFEFLKEV